VPPKTALIPNVPMVFSYSSFRALSACPMLNVGMYVCPGCPTGNESGQNEILYTQLGVVAETNKDSTLSKAAHTVQLLLSRTNSRD